MVTGLCPPSDNPASWCQSHLATPGRARPPAVTKPSLQSALSTLGTSPSRLGELRALKNPCRGRRSWGDLNQRGMVGRPGDSSFPSTNTSSPSCRKTPEPEVRCHPGTTACLAKPSPGLLCAERSGRCRGTAGRCSAHRCQILLASTLHRAGSRSQPCSWVLLQVTAHLAKMLDPRRGAHRT